MDNFPDDLRQDSGIKSILGQVDASDYINGIGCNVSALLKRSDLHKWALSQFVRTGLFTSPCLPLKLLRQEYSNE